LAMLEEGCYSDTMTCTRGCSYSFMYSWWWVRTNTRNMWSDFAVKKYLHAVASCWILLIYSYDARNHEYKIKWKIVFAVEYILWAILHWWGHRKRWNIYHIAAKSCLLFCIIVDSWVGCFSLQCFICVSDRGRITAVVV